MNRIPFQLVWFCLFLAGTLAAKPLAFFEAHCVKCHNAEKAKGMVRLDSLGLPVVAENYETWREVVHQLQRGDMPPTDVEQRPKADSRRAFLAQVLPALARHEADARGPADPLMRLSNNQLAHSLCICALLL